MYVAVKKKACAEYSPGASRTMSSIGDFRTDFVRNDSSTCNWEFQINMNPESSWGKETMNGSESKGTHKVYYSGNLNINKVFLAAINKL